MGSEPVVEVPSLKGVFLKDTTTYLWEFWRKPRKIPIGYVDKQNWGLNLALPVYQFWAQNHTAIVGAKDGQFNIQASHGVRTWELRYSSRLP